MPRERLVLILIALASASTGHAGGPVSFVSDLGSEPLNAGSGPQSFLEAHGLLYFSAEDDQHGRELWRTDGTAEGTSLVRDLRPGRGGSNPVLLETVGEALFLQAYDEVAGWSLWRTDGSDTAPTLVRRIPSGRRRFPPIHWLRHLGTRIVLSVGGHELAADLVVADADLAELTTIDVCPGPCFTGPSPPYLLDGAAYFFSWSPAGGRDLWRTDGTAGGTERLYAGCPGCNPSSQPMADLDGSLYFAGDEGGIWRTDGTAAGTGALAPRAGAARPTSIVRVGPRLYFTAPGVEGGATRLWRTDGSAAGTLRLDGLVPAGGSVSQIRALAGKLFYVVLLEGGAHEAWAYDGHDPRLLFSSQSIIFTTDLLERIVMRTTHGTFASDGTAVEAIAPLPFSGFSPTYDASRFFAGFDSANGVELWRLEGSSLETSLVRDLRPAHREAYFGAKLPFRGEVHFAGSAYVAGSEQGNWWRTDHRASGATIVESEPGVLPFAASSQTLFLTDNWSFRLMGYDGEAVEELVDEIEVMQFVVADERLTFAPWAGQSIWRSNGTPEGTTLVRSINADWYNFCPIPCDPQPLPTALTPSGALVFFLASEADLFQLWVTDGSDAGTFPVWTADVGPFEDYSFIDDAEIVPWRGGVLFVTQLPKPRLYRSGPAGPAGMIAEFPGGSARSLTPAEGQTFFVVRDAQDHDHLWRTDGTWQQTRELPYLPPGAAVGEMAAMGSRVFLTVHEPGTGSELWVSDGTAAGTGRVMDLAPGPRGSSPSQLTPVGDRLLFAADDGRSGQELWLTDGTAAGTWQVDDTAPGRNASSPESLTLDGERVYFEADDGSRRGLFVLDLAAAAQGLVFADGFESADPSAWTLAE